MPALDPLYPVLFRKMVAPLSDDALADYSRRDPQHEFLHPVDPTSSRSPCPALNALANHRYISHDGKNISYFALINALCAVYNISRPLAHVLAIVGYITCGKLSFARSGTSTISIPHLSWTLDLASLSQQGPFKIAHNASFVHPNNTPSHSPDPTLVAEVLDYATLSKGLSLRNLAHMHALRLAQSDRPLSGFHEQIALGESALFWLLMREREESGDNDVIPVERVRQWLCDERLPNDWWTDARPAQPVGLSLAHSTANRVKQLMTRV